MASEIVNNHTWSHKRSLGIEFRSLPQRYLHITIRPSVMRFEEEKYAASWGSTFLQLITLGVICALLQGLAFWIDPSTLVGMTGGVQLGVLMLASTIGIVIITPLSFLFSAGVIYLFARLLRGKGAYLEQLYTMTLFGVPMVILSYLLLLLPATSSWLPYLPHVYSLVLMILALRAVHNFLTGRAIITLLLPVVALLLLIVIGAVLYVALAH
ncbi:hypothetical protein KSD_90370 [Ktedonobacter sp. SOSP1-85]|uniref:YIP1 family protein n=1 Tax=Ktedonobacter sp. SOSP1-85 TaxID=2778367 RepID=UPI0019161188|nr:YIP1 family protein [Ktedonobacter sp. SOSP1-85]GHO81266.1 hypothetical protein KSD_90370 [Ktedonobacter sp. SOSP1-85]